MSMTKRKSTLKWEEAIGDARKQIKRLQAAVATCEEKKANGEPWPGTLKGISAGQQVNVQRGENMGLECKAPPPLYRSNRMLDLGAKS